MKNRLIRAFAIAVLLAGLAAEKAWADFCSGYVIAYEGVEYCCDNPDGIGCIAQ